MKYLVYSITQCPFCDKAKELLEDKGLEYIETGVETDPKLGMSIVRETGQRTWPQIFKDGEFIGGYTELKAHLEES